MNTTLDVDTTYEFLIISDDLRNVQCGNIIGCKHVLRDSATHFVSWAPLASFLAVTTGKQCGTKQRMGPGSLLRVCSPMRRDPTVYRAWIPDLKSETTKLFFGQHWAWTALWVNLQLHWVRIFQDVDFGKFPFMTLVMKVISLHLPKFQLLSYRAHSFPLQVQVMVIKPPWVSVLWINLNFLLFLHRSQTWTDKPKITKWFYGKCLCAHTYDLFCLVHILEKMLVQK